MSMLRTIAVACIVLWMVVRVALAFRPDQPMPWSQVVGGLALALCCLAFVWFI